VTDDHTREPRVARPPVRPLGSDGDRTRSDRTQLIRVAAREGVDTSRTSPRMRFDLLQIVAWTVGLAFVVVGLVAIARAGFDELGAFEPVVEVGGHPSTPLLAMLWLVLGVSLLAAGTGEVAERRLRIGGALLGVLGVVWLIEAAAFTPYLGVERESGALLVGVGVALTAASYVPPLSIARPGVPER
jgi:hypothetical protein